MPHYSWRTTQHNVLPGMLILQQAATTPRAAPGRAEPRGGKVETYSTAPKPKCSQVQLQGVLFHGISAQLQNFESNFDLPEKRCQSKYTSCLLKIHGEIHVNSVRSTEPGAHHGCVTSPHPKQCGHCRGLWLCQRDCTPLSRAEGLCVPLGTNTSELTQTCFQLQIMKGRELVGSSHVTLHCAATLLSRCLASAQTPGTETWHHHGGCPSAWAGCLCEPSPVIYSRNGDSDLAWKKPTL